MHDRRERLTFGHTTSTVALLPRITDHTLWSRYSVPWLSIILICVRHSQVTHGRNLVAQLLSFPPNARIICHVPLHFNLLLSRMMLGRRVTTKTMLDVIRSVGRNRNASNRSLITVSTSKTPIRHFNRRVLPVSTTLRNKSTAAAATDLEEDHLHAASGNAQGHAAAAEARNELNNSHAESWMINLGRGTNNQWLTGPRSEDWFTGLPPSQCPGKSL